MTEICRMSTERDGDSICTISVSVFPLVCAGLDEDRRRVPVLEQLLWLEIKIMVRVR